MRITIAMLSLRFGFEPVSHHQVRIKATSSLSPRGGLPMVLRERGSGHKVGQGLCQEDANRSCCARDEFGPFETAL
jgi:hypothetical protein